MKVINKKVGLVLLFFIIVLAAVIRLWQIGNVPPSPDWDEAALGYNAYSIMQTGRDEYGQFLPTILRSFDDYKPALYAYLIVPFIKVFGLNIISVRLPSAIVGILTVLVTFFLVKELFKRVDLALLSSFILAISPMSVQFSRIAFEANVAMGLNAAAILLFLKSFKKPWFLFVSLFVMGLNLYMYQSEKVFVPLLLIVLAFVFRRELLKIPKKYLITSIAIIFLLSIPLTNFILTNKDALARAKGVSIFSDLTPFLKENVQKVIEDKRNKDYLGLILDNRRFEFAKSIVSGYVSHFDFNWLFITGDIARHHAPGMGIMSLWELPFLLIGIYMLVFGRFERSAKLAIFLWFLIAPIPASITSGVPHSVRTLNFLPTFQVFTAIGVLSVISSISKIQYQILKIPIKYLIFSMCIFFAIFNIVYYLNQYFVQQNYFNSKEWQYGYKEAVSEINRVEGKYSKIIVSNQPHLDQSYMFFLFYLKYPPSLYQKDGAFSSGGFRENHKFGKYEFRPIDWNKEIKSPNTLYVGRPADFTDYSKILKTINFLNGEPAIQIVEG